MAKGRLNNGRKTNREKPRLVHDLSDPRRWPRERWSTLTNSEFTTAFINLLDKRAQGKQKMLDILADVERRRQNRQTQESTAKTNGAPGVHKVDLPVQVNREEPVIRKVALEPTGLASFDEDLEEEIDVTNLKD